MSLGHDPAQSVSREFVEAQSLGFASLICLRSCPDCFTEVEADGAQSSVVFLGFRLFLGLPTVPSESSLAPSGTEDGFGLVASGVESSVKGFSATGSHPFLMFSAIKASATRSASAADMAVRTSRSSGVFRSGL